MNESISVLNALLEDKENKQTEIATEISTLEKKLSDSSQQLQKIEEKISYLKGAAQFLEKIKRLNIYKEEPLDAREPYIQRMTEIIQKSMSASPLTVTALPEKLFSADTEDNSNLEENSPIVQPSPKISNSIESELIQKIKKLMDTLSSFSEFPKSQPIPLEAFSCKQNLKEAIVELLCLEHLNKKSEKTRRALIIESEQILEKAPTLENALMRSFLDSDLEAFKSFFEFDTFTATRIPQIGRYLAHVLGERSILLPKKIELLDYLYATSKAYRNFIFCQTTTQEIQIYYQFGSFQVSPLAASMLMHNLAVFEMLLRHGANPNEYGFVYDDKLISSLRFAIMLDSTREETPFLKRLLKEGAFVDHSFVTSNTDYSKLKLSKELDPAYSEFFKSNFLKIEKTLDLVLLEETNTLTSNLLFSCMMGNYSAIPVLLKASFIKTSLFNLAEGIAHLIDPSDFQMGRIYSSQRSGLSFHPDQTEAIQSLEQSQTRKQKITLFTLPFSPKRQLILKLEADRFYIKLLRKNSRKHLLSLFLK